MAGRQRIIDGDEGIYLFASCLVFEGKLPYRDFLYPQMSLLPYAYGLWMKVGGADLTADLVGVIRVQCL